MKITDNRMNGPVCFANLKNGAIFEFNGDFFIKIPEHHYVNAIALVNGSHFTFNIDDEVIKVTCELVIS